MGKIRDNSTAFVVNNEIGIGYIGKIHSMDPVGVLLKDVTLLPQSVVNSMSEEDIYSWWKMIDHRDAHKAHPSTMAYVTWDKQTHMMVRDYDD